MSTKRAKKKTQVKRFTLRNGLDANEYVVYAKTAAEAGSLFFKAMGFLAVTIEEEK
jgi:hypothetical protein